MDLAELEFVDPGAGLGSAAATIQARRPTELGEPRSTDPASLPTTIVGGGTRWDVADWLEATHTTSLLILDRHGVAFEWYAADCSPASLFLGASATKSVLAELVGLAVARGRLGWDDRVTDHVPELATGGYRDTTLLDAITMTSGVDWVEDHRDPQSPASRLLQAFAGGGDSRALLPRIPGGVGPGRRFVYNTADSQVVDWVRERATGVAFPDAVQELWDLLGAERAATVGLDGAGVALAGGSLAASARDWARIGLLALTGTDAEGRRILPDRWTRDAFRPAADFTGPAVLPATITTLLGFGRHWWPVDHQGTVATADGSRGQFVYVDTEQHLVLVKTSRWPYADPFQDRQLRDLSILGLQALAAHAGH